MNRFYSVFLVGVFSCTFAFSQSTNFTGTGSETIGFTNLSFSGEAGGDAAVLSSLLSFYSTNTAYQGGIGPDLSGNATDLDGTGGSGLRLIGVSSAKVVGSESIGADAGTVVQENAGRLSSAVGGNGIGVGVLTPSPFAPAISLEVAGLVARGGHGGDITADSGSFENLADGGSGISVLLGKVKVDVADSEIYGGDGGSVVSGGTESSSAKGGSGLSIRKAPFTKFESAVFSNLMAFGGRGGSISTLGEADASGGHGVGVTQASGPVVVEGEGGTYVGGSGGGITGASAATANGGDGFRYIGNATEDNSLIISNGTFQGAAGGTVSGIAGSATANGGNGLYAEEATVEIHGGDFSGSAAGTANGIEGVTGVGLRTSNSTVTVHGGAFDAAEFSGTSTLSLQGGDFAGDVVFTDGITADLSLGSSMNVAGEMVQFGGAVNVDAWSAQHFQNTVIYGGTMNFSGQGFNLVDGSSFKLLDTGSTVNFNGGFTAESGSEITTVFDGTTPSAITGTDLVFEEGVKWTIHGVSTTANGDTITMASATSSLSNNIDSADVEYIGASWAAVLTVTNEANNLVGIYGYASLEDSLGLDPEDGGFGTTMAQLSEFTDFENSGDGDYVALKNLPTQEAATAALKGQFDDNAMVGALIQMQGLFADQIKNRTRSYRYYKNGGGAVSYSPQGAQGPDAWNKGMDSLNDSLPSWDARGTMRNLDDSLPNWDSTGSHEAPAKKVSTNQPKSKRNKIKVPSTWQTWGRGYGSYFNQDETADLVGYDATVGGGVLGVDKRLDHLLLGLGGGYAHTYMNGNGGGEDEVATFYGTAYAAMSGGKGFLEFNANYAFNDVETEGSAAAGDYLGDYNASTLGMYLGGGMDFPIFKDSLLLTPEASMLATYYVRDSYTETSSSVDDWPDMTWDDYDQMSYLGSLGATLSMIKQIEAFNLEMGFHPEVRAHYLHEFNADMDADSYLMEGYADPIGVVLQAREEDLLKLGTGVRFSKWNSDTLEFGLDLDVLFGQDYEAYIGSVKLLHRF